MAYLVIKENNVLKSYKCTNICNKPRLQVYGNYIPIVTNTGNGIYCNSKKLGFFTSIETTYEIYETRESISSVETVETNGTYTVPAAGGSLIFQSTEVTGTSEWDDVQGYAISSRQEDGYTKSDGGFMEGHWVPYSTSWVTLHHTAPLIGTYTCTTYTSHASYTSTGKTTLSYNKTRSSTSNTIISTSKTSYFI